MRGGRGGRETDPKGVTVMKMESQRVMKKESER